MNPLLRKEVRLILPSWLVAVVLAMGPVWIVPADTIAREGGWWGGMAYLFALAGMLPSLALFGQEFSLGTFPLWLTQPASRRRLWQAKMGVWLAALLLLFLAGWMSSALRIRVAAAPFPSWAATMICVGVMFVCSTGALWTTLLVRQVSMAFWLTIVAPLVLVYGMASSVRAILGTSSPFPEWLAVVGLSLYSIAGFLWARRLFLGAQDVQWTGGAIALPAWRFVRAGTTNRRRPGVVRALFRKEIQFHHVSLLMAGVLLILQVISLLIRRANPGRVGDSTTLIVLTISWFFLWLLLPYLIGAMAVAEERKLGTWESFRSLPVRRSAQFWVKYVTVLFLSIAVCAVLPWAIEGVGVRWGMQGAAFQAAFRFEDLLVLVALCAGLATVAFFASTQTRNTLQAVGVAFVLNSPLLWFGTGLFSIVVAGRDYMGGPRLTLLMGLATYMVTLFCLAYQNFKHVNVGRALWLRNVVVLAVALGVTFAASALIHNRSWELLMTLESPHGPARLHGPVRPRICMAYGIKLFVLVPDGRVWVAGKYEWKRLDEYKDSGSGQRVTVEVPLPLTGKFLTKSNWTTIAGCGRLVCGIQSDGSLWTLYDRRGADLNQTNLSIIPTPARMGTDSDWSALAGEYHFLALKSDGSLWGWGNNHSHQLGLTETDYVQDPVRIGTNSDWASVYVSEDTSIGVKRDGSVWKWGMLPYGRHGEPNTTALPERWNLDGSQWVALAGGPQFDLELRRDGTLWASGRLPSDVLGRQFSRPFAEFAEFAEPVRVGDDSVWKDISSRGNTLAAIRRDGTLFENLMYAGGSGDAGVLKLSKHSDWMGVLVSWQGELALAADGTLSLWQRPDSGRGLLGPTRRPAWSLNILTMAGPP